MVERTGGVLHGVALEEALAALLYDRETRERLRAGEAHDPRFLGLDVDELEDAARGVARMVRDRSYRGLGGVEAWFPRSLAVWRASHPDDAELEKLFTRFCASPSCRSWREIGVGISLEEAFYRFLVDACAIDPAIAEDELLAAIVRALAVTPNAAFEWPAMLRQAPGGCYALTRELHLHAALDGTYVEGSVTPLIAALLQGEPDDAVARAYGSSDVEIETLKQALRARRLLAARPQRR